jgi:hypothetical protein
MIGSNTEMSGSMMYVPDSQLVQDDDEAEPTGRSASTAGAETLAHDDNPAPVQTSHVVITTTKVSVTVLLNTYVLISRHAVAVMQWSVGLITSCCSSGLTQHL